MVGRLAALLLVLAANAMAQPVCPAVSFVAAPQVNLKPTATTHVDLVRQSDGFYTAFEVADAAPYRVVRTTPHFEKQVAACSSHTLPTMPSLAPVAANPQGAGSQVQASEAIGGNVFVAHISADQSMLLFDLFDAQHNLISERQFAPPAGGTGNSPVTQIFQSVALADLNGDGKLDLIAALVTFSSAPSHAGPPPGTYSASLWTFVSNGDGTFQNGASQTVVISGPTIAGLTFAVGDLNGDGKADVVVFSPGVPGYSILLGNGDGTLRPPSGPPTFFENCEDAGSVTLADLNSDGKPDLVLGPCNDDLGKVAIALGNGDGTFQKASVFSALPAGYAQGAAAMITVGDVNGDGIPDIITSGGTILFGDGKGGVASRADYSPSLYGTGFANIIPSGGGPALLASSVMLGDFDGDGKVDILFGTGNPGYLSGTTGFPSFSVLFGAGGGVFTGAPVSGVPVPLGGFVYSGPLPPPEAVMAVADFGADGVPEVAVASLNATSQTPWTLWVNVYQSGRNGTFTGMPQQSFSYGTVLLRAAASGDFNHDGKPDLAVLLADYPANGEIDIFLGNGDGTFRAPIVNSVAINNPLFLTEADLNGDGVSDLVVGSQGNPQVFLGNGDGTFKAPITVQAGFDDPGIVLGDFNGDGKTDMAVAGTAAGVAPSVNLLLGNGDGTFGKPISSPLPSAASGYNGQIAAADFNGDGRLDVAVAMGPPPGGPLTGPTQLAILPGNGDGSFGPAVVGAGMGDFTAADFNGDGVPDLIGLVNPSTPFPAASGALSVRAGNGDGTFQADEALSGAAALYAVTDLNGDGLPDVVDFYGDGLLALINDSPVAAPLTVVSAASYAPGPLAPGEIAAAFGAGFVPTGQAAAFTVPLPVQVAGLGVTVTDSAGVSRPAQLYSASTGQIDFVIPTGTAVGMGTVTVNGAASGKALSAAVQIAAVAPSLFTVDQGIAAATAVQVAPNGAQTPVALFASAAGGLTTVPIDLTQPGSVYLMLFGTGFEGASAGSVTATVEGVSATVSYAGPQGTYPGLDQINILLPASLAGLGAATVEISAGGVSANPVAIAIR